jgi:hypothetical protein
MTMAIQRGLIPTGRGASLDRAIAGRVLSSHEILRIGLVRIFVASGLWLTLIV